MQKFINQSIRSVIESFNGQLDSLSTDESTIEYISDILSDLEITTDEKQETIQGILELHLDPCQQQHNSQLEERGSTSSPTQTDEFDPKVPKTIQESVQALIKRVDSYLSTSTAHSEEEDRSVLSSSRFPAARARSSSESSCKKLSKCEEEEEKIKDLEIKRAIVDQYGKVEIDQSLLNQVDHCNGKTKKVGVKIDQDASEDKVQKDLLDQELKLLDLKKRQRKKIESKKYTTNEDLLLRPNLNSKLVDHENKVKKQELAEKNKLKIQKDKADLIKQRENQEKKKTEARLKARKLERRA